jgi:hypothetical protein
MGKVPPAYWQDDTEGRGEDCKRYDANGSLERGSKRNHHYRKRNDKLAVICSNDPDVIITESTVTGTEKVQWDFIPEVSQSPRLGLHAHEKGANYYTASLQSEYPPNPPFHKEVIKGVNTVQQALKVGGGYTTAWKVSDSEKDRTTTLYLTVGYTFPQNTHAAQAGKNYGASRVGVETMKSAHRRVWIPTILTIFIFTRHTFGKVYWIQQYTFIIPISNALKTLIVPITPPIFKYYSKPQLPNKSLYIYS